MPKVVNPRTEYRVNPLGIDVRQPRFSWQTQCRRPGIYQIAYQITAASTPELLDSEEPDLWTAGAWSRISRSWCRMKALRCSRGSASTGAWSSGTIAASSESANPPGSRWACWNRTTGRRNGSAERSWAARIRPSRRRTFAANLNWRHRCSPPAYTSLHWDSSNAPSTDKWWATTSSPPDGRTTTNAFNTRSTMWPTCCRQVTTPSARCWATVGRSARVGMGSRQQYQRQPQLLAQLEVTLTDGSRQVISTDGGWMHQYGPLLDNDMQGGEAYDARLEFPGWAQPGFDEAGWLPVKVFETKDAALVAHNSPQVKRIQELSPVGEPKKDGDLENSYYIFDMGQNMVGRVRFKGSAPAGTTDHSALRRGAGRSQRNVHGQPA